MQVGKTDKALDANIASLAEQALAAILSTEKFECSPQMSAFLRYVVNETISGNQSRIKAFSVAVDALGKPNSFDPQNDPVVRVLAGRLRTALDKYAEEHPNVPLAISMKKGSYIPIFSGPSIDSDAPYTADTELNLQQQAKVGEVIVGSENLVSTPHVDQGAPATANSMNGSLANSGFHNSPPQGTAQSETQYPSNEPWSLGTLLHSFRTYRSRWTIAAAVLFAGFGLLQTSELRKSTEPQLKAALATADVKPRYRFLAKPSAPCIYISAVSSGDTVDDSLNTIVSGALAHNDKIVVHRILRGRQSEHFWLEDYILSFESLDLEGESRVNIQLIAAATGRVLYNKPVSLTAHTTEQLSSASLATIIEAAESVVAANGPLFQHFNDNSSQGSR